MTAGDGGATTWPARRPPSVVRPVGHWVVRTSTELTAARRELVALAADIPAPPGAEATGRPVIALPDRLALLLSELVTNVLRHAEPPAEVLVLQGDGRCLIDVADPAVDVPPTPEGDRSPGLGGHGLPLVAELAVDRGWYVEGDHKHVWAVLRTGV